MKFCCYLSSAFHLLKNITSKNPFWCRLAHMVHVFRHWHTRQKMRTSITRKEANCSFKAGIYYLGLKIRMKSCVSRAGSTGYQDWARAGRHKAGHPWLQQGIRFCLFWEKVRNRKVMRLYYQENAQADSPICLTNDSTMTSSPLKQISKPKFRK